MHKGCPGPGPLLLLLTGPLLWGYSFLLKGTDVQHVRVHQMRSLKQWPPLELGWDHQESGHAATRSRDLHFHMLCSRSHCSFSPQPWALSSLAETSWGQNSSWTWAILLPSLVVPLGISLFSQKFYVPSFGKRSWETKFQVLGGWAMASSLSGCNEMRFTSAIHPMAQAKPLARVQETHFFDIVMLRWRKTPTL